MWFFNWLKKRKNNSVGYISLSVGTEFPLNKAPPIESIGTFLNTGMIYFIVYRNSPFEDALVNLEATNHFRSIIYTDQIGWPVISLLFGSDFVVSNALTQNINMEQIGILENADSPAFLIVLVDRNTNIIKKIRTLGIDGSFKGEILKYLRISGSVPGHSAQQLAQEIPSNNLFRDGKCWKFSEKTDNFHELSRQEVYNIFAP